MRMKENFVYELLRDITALGSWLFTTLGLVILISLKQYNLVIQLVIGLTLVYIVGIGIRSIYFKERPQQLVYSNIMEKLYASSFPSIHSMRIWLYVIIFIIYFRNTLVTVILTVVGVSVAYSRIYLRKHDSIDIIAGSIIGVLLGFIVQVL